MQEMITLAWQAPRSGFARRIPRNSGRYEVHESRGDLLIAVMGLEVSIVWMLRVTMDESNGVGGEVASRLSMGRECVLVPEVFSPKKTRPSSNSCTLFEHKKTCFKVNLICIW